MSIHPKPVCGDPVAIEAPIARAIDSTQPRTVDQVARAVFRWDAAMDAARSLPIRGVQVVSSRLCTRKGWNHQGQFARAITPDSVLPPAVSGRAAVR